MFFDLVVNEIYALDQLGVFSHQRRTFNSQGGVAAQRFDEKGEVHIADKLDISLGEDGVVGIGDIMELEQLLGEHFILADGHAV